MGTGARVGPSQAVADASGDWTFTGAQAFDVRALADGSLIIQAVAEDRFGNRATALQFLTKDTTANDLFISSPITPDNVINNAEAAAGYTFTGSAEPGSTITVAVVASNSASFTPASTITAGADGSWSAFINLSSIVDGSARVTATQTDLNGNSAAAPDVAFSVDRTPPALTLVNPPDASLIGSSGIGAVVVDGTTVANGIVRLEFSDGVDTLTRVVTANAAG